MKRYLSLLIAALFACSTPTDTSSPPLDLAAGHKNSTADVTIVPGGPLELAPGDTVRVRCELRRADGRIIAGRKCAWKTFDSTVVTVSPLNAVAVNVVARGPGSSMVRAGNGGHQDTLRVSVTSSEGEPEPPPTDPPPTGRTFFLADAESGAVVPPWSFKGSRPGADCSTNPCPSPSTARAKNGTRSYEFEVTDPSTDGHSTFLHTYAPQTAMPGGARYQTGYYSGWYYVDAGFTGTKPGQDHWNMLLGWMASGAIAGNPDPIGHIGLEVWGGTLQMVYVLKNASVGNYTAPAITGYQREGGSSFGWYLMTASSPAGVVPFPRNRWVHVAVYYKMARANGQVTIWQDGVKVMDLTAPTFNTMDGHVTMTSPQSSMVLQHVIYEGPTTGTQRYYLDDFRVSDYRPVPGQQ